MIIADQKKALMTIMARRTPKGEPVASGPMKTENVKDESGEPDPRHAAAQDMLAAMHEKSPEKLMEAMASFVDLHGLRNKESED